VHGEHLSRGRVKVELTSTYPVSSLTHHRRLSAAQDPATSGCKSESPLLLQVQVWDLETLEHAASVPAGPGRAGVWALAAAGRCMVGAVGAEVVVWGLE
jgi:hypothetical protein